MYLFDSLLPKTNTNLIKIGCSWRLGINKNSVVVDKEGYSICIVSNKVKVGDTITFKINDDETWMSVGIVQLYYPLEKYYIGENKDQKAFGIRSNGNTYYKMGTKVYGLNGK